MVPKSHFWDGNRLRRSFFTMLFSSVWSITFQLSRLELLWNMPQKAENVRNMPAKYQIYICYSTEKPWFQSSVLPPFSLIKKKSQFFRQFSIVRRRALNPSLGAKTAVRIENTPIFRRFRGQISKKNIPTSSKWISNAISKSGPTRPAGGPTGPAVRERVKSYLWVLHIQNTGT